MCQVGACKPFANDAERVSSTQMQQMLLNCCIEDRSEAGNRSGSTKQGAASPTTSVEASPLELRFEISNRLADERDKPLKLVHYWCTIAKRNLNRYVLPHVYVFAGQDRL